MRSLDFIYHGGYQKGFSCHLFYVVYWFTNNKICTWCKIEMITCKFSLYLCISPLFTIFQYIMLVFFSGKLHISSFEWNTIHVMCWYHLLRNYYFFLKKLAASVWGERFRWHWHGTRWDGTEVVRLRNQLLQSAGNHSSQRGGQQTQTDSGELQKQGKDLE